MSLNENVSNAESFARVKIADACRAVITARRTFPPYVNCASHEPRENYAREFARGDGHERGDEIEAVVLHSRLPRGGKDTCGDAVYTRRDLILLSAYNTQLYPLDGGRMRGEIETQHLAYNRESALSRDSFSAANLFPH